MLAPPLLTKQKDARHPLAPRASRGVQYDPQRRFPTTVEPGHP